MHQFALDVHRIVDARQQHTLVAQRHARPRQPVAGRRQFRRDLFRVVDVDVKPEWVILRHHLAELFGDAHRQKDGYTGANADDFHVGNSAQAGQNHVQ